tara:strand:+ start:271 stop:1074 length:804 start_codon:yes stop_codon:yes gene_type:complete
MIKIFKKLVFKTESDKLKKYSISNVIRDFELGKNKNLVFLVKKRFEWMQDFIKSEDIGLEVGAGAAFSKKILNSKLIHTSDFSNDSHLDFKNIDAEKTQFNNSSYDFVIASNMIHHVPHPVLFLEEMHRILKKGGRLIIFEPHVSVFYQLITLMTKHESFDFTVDAWDKNKSVKIDDNPWNSNQAVAYLLFKNKNFFEKKMEGSFKIIYENYSEFFIFINSGGIYSKCFYVPLNYTLLNVLNLIDKFLVKFFPNIFALGRKIVLEKV